MAGEIERVPFPEPSGSRGRRNARAQTAAQVPELSATTRVMLTLQRMRWPLVFSVAIACLFLPVPGPAKATVISATVVLVFWIPFLHLLGVRFAEGWREGGDGRPRGRR